MCRVAKLEGTKEVLARGSFDPPSQGMSNLQKATALVTAITVTVVCASLWQTPKYEASARVLVAL
jgi:hypothetical protein